MKTLEQIKKDYISTTIDGRDVIRLANFLPEKDLSIFGVSLKEEYVGKHVPLELTKENILQILKSDVAFGFENLILL